VIQHRKRRPSLRLPEPIDGVIARSGEDRFAPARPPIPEHVWREAVGVRISERAKPIAIERGVLIVKAATSVWATELSLLTTTLVERLRAHGVLINELRFRVGSIDPPARPPDRHVSRAVPPPGPLPRPLADSIAQVDDGELQVAIARAARANLAWQAHAVAPSLGALSAQRDARAPRSAAGESDPPARTSAASREAPRCTPGGGPGRRS
jgi:hypothetical protein